MGKALNRKFQNLCALNHALANITVIAPLIMHLVIREKLWRYVYPIALYTIYIRIGSLVVATIYMLIVIKVPSDHLHLVTLSRIYFALVVSWTISLIPAVKCSVVMSDKVIFSDSFLWTYTVIESTVIFIIAFLIIFAVLVKAMCTKSDNGIELKDNLETGEQTVCIVMNAEGDQRMLKMFCIMDILHGITLSPYIIGVMVVLISPNNANFILSVSYLVYASTAVVDPLLVVYFNRDYSKVLRFGCRVNNAGTPDLVAHI